ncbi:MAG: hypothetical protein QW063_00015 [Candidatus Nanoarchaeia archaeon]
MVKIPICPRCKNPNIYLSNPAAGWLLPEQWVCDKCGYIGYVVQEIDTADLEKKGKK